jgi:hypothetical protein
MRWAGNWQSIVNGFHGPTYIIAAVVVIALVIAAWRYLRRRPVPATAHSPQAGLAPGDRQYPGGGSHQPGTRTPR